MSFPKYPEYKDSGCEWLGEVPKHWELKRAGHFFEERREKVSDKDFQPLSVTKNGILPQIETAAKSDDGDNRKKVCVGDFVINSRSDRKGSSGVSLLCGSVSLINTVLCPRGGVHGDFIHHLFRSVDFQEEYYRYGKGIVADLWSTNYSEMKNVMLAMPPMEEQRLIADFINEEVKKSNDLIVENKKFIKLLNEKRQAVIARAVTKGISSSVKTKSSGVDWLGEVPAHWAVKKLKYISRFSGGGTPSRDKVEYWGGDIPWVSPKDMKSDLIFDTEEKITQEGLDASSSNIVLPGTLLMVVRSGILKHTIPVAITTKEVALNQDMKAINFTKSNGLGKFFLRWVQGLNDQLLLQWAKQGATVESIENSYLADTVIPIPPEGEQKTINEFLDVMVERYSKLIRQSEVSVNLLIERQSALISAAVTGKIDVRNTSLRMGMT